VILRRVRHEDGDVGLCSTWLETLPIGAPTRPTRRARRGDRVEVAVLGGVDDLGSRPAAAPLCRDGAPPGVPRIAERSCGCAALSWQF